MGSGFVAHIETPGGNHRVGHSRAKTLGRLDFITISGILRQRNSREVVPLTMVATLDKGTLLLPRN